MLGKFKNYQCAIIIFVNINNVCRVETDLFNKKFVFSKTNSPLDYYFIRRRRLKSPYRADESANLRLLLR